MPSTFAWGAALGMVRKEIERERERERERAARHPPHDALSRLRNPTPVRPTAANAAPCRPTRQRPRTPRRSPRPPAPFSYAPPHAQREALPHLVEVVVGPGRAQAALEAAHGARHAAVSLPHGEELGHVAVLHIHRTRHAGRRRPGRRRTSHGEGDVARLAVGERQGRGRVQRCHTHPTRER